MPSYICSRCNFKTSQRANFKRHLTRKNLCEPINTDVSIKSIAESYGIEISSTENLCVTPNVVQQNGVTVNRSLVTQRSSSPISNKIEQCVVHRHKCDYCDKRFATRQGKYKHKQRCKFKINKSTYTKEEFEREVKKKIEEEKKKIDVIADKRAQKMVLSLVDKLIPNQTITNSNNTQNIQNNIQNNNNQQLKINNFGKETTNHISDEQLKIMFVDPRNTVIQHIKDTHYHLLHPENFNAKITNYKSKHMKIYQDNGWITVNKKATICSMYNKHERIMNREFEKLKAQLPDKVREGYKEYKQLAHTNYHTYNQRLIDTEAVIITGTQQQKNIDLLRKEEVLRLAKEQNKTPSEIFAEHMPDIFAEREKFLDTQGL